MSQTTLMQVSLRLPTRLLFSCAAEKVFAEAENGAFTLLPKHTDFVTALLPSVLVITDAAGVEQYFGIDQGVLVKHGYNVDIAVRRGVQGEDLTSLNETIRQHLLQWMKMSGWRALPYPNWRRALCVASVIYGNR